MGLDLAGLRVEHFDRRIGERFYVDISKTAAAALELIEVGALSPGSSPPSAFRPPFRLLFRGPQGPVFEQRILPLRHAEMGKLEMFLVPIGPDAHGMRYEAIFT